VLYLSVGLSEAAVKLQSSYISKIIMHAR